jgi:hypothetical protein
VTSQPTTRLVVRIVCMVLALVMLAASVLLALEVALALAGQPHLLVDGSAWSERGRTLAWSEPSNLALASLLVLVGLVLLTLAWWPRRDEVVPASLPQPHVDGDAGTGAGPVSAPVAATIRRRELETTLADSARRIDTITDATVKVRRGTVKVNATTARRDEGDLRERVHAAVSDAAQRWAVDFPVTTARIATSGDDT